MIGWVFETQTNKQTNKQFLPTGVDFRNAGTFSQDLFCTYNHVFIIVPVYRLLEYPRRSGFRNILGRWRSILWRFPAIFHFDATGPNLPAIFHCTKELHFLRRIFWANKTSGYFKSQKVTRFSWNLLLHPSVRASVCVCAVSMWQPSIYVYIYIHMNIYSHIYVFVT